MLGLEIITFAITPLHPILSVLYKVVYLHMLLIDMMPEVSELSEAVRTSSHLVYKDLSGEGIKNIDFFRTRQTLQNPGWGY